MHSVQYHNRVHYHPRFSASAGERGTDFLQIGRMGGGCPTILINYQLSPQARQDAGSFKVLHLRFKYLLQHNPTWALGLFLGSPFLVFLAFCYQGVGTGLFLPGPTSFGAHSQRTLAGCAFVICTELPFHPALSATSVRFSSIGNSIFALFESLPLRLLYLFYIQPPFPHPPGNLKDFF